MVTCKNVTNKLPLYLKLIDMPDPVVQPPIKGTPPPEDDGEETED